MATYVDQAFCEAHIEGLNVSDPAAFDRLIERAELELDNHIRWPPAGTSETTTGPKLTSADIAKLSVRQQDYLKRATAAQVEYMIESGEAHLIVPELPHSGPDFNVEGQLPRVGPKAIDFLKRARLSSAWARMIGGRLPSMRRNRRRIVL